MHIPINIVRAAVALVAAATLTGRPVNAQSLSSEERQIVSNVDAQVNDALTLFEKVVNIESATQNLAGVKRVGEVFRRELEALGFSTKWVDLAPSMKRAGHLFAERSGTRGKRLLLIGHLDTVLEGERFTRDGAIARGSGTVDMKGGDVVLLFALKALQSVGALDQRRIIVAFTGDEESVGRPVEVSRRELLEAGRRSDFALAFEEAVGETATVARRGNSTWTLEVSGTTGHSGDIFGPNLGSGAIFEAARILNAFHETLRGEKYLTFNPSVIVGGTDVEYGDGRGTAAGKNNVVSQKVVVRGDLRFISEEQKEGARTKMKGIVAQSLPRTNATIAFEDGYPAMSPTQANDALLQQLDQVSRDLGFGKIDALDPGERGAGDISFVAPVVSGLDGLGVKGRGAHAPGEVADLGSLSVLIKRAAVLIYRLTQ